MDLGLGHLTQLKAFVLNEGLRAASTYDAALAVIGRGVAASFETFCDRKFARLVGATCEDRARDWEIVLDRYPVESVTKIELRETLTDGWQDQGAVADVLLNLSERAGILSFAAPLSTLQSSRVRITFTGGYWYPTAAARTVVSGEVALASGDSAAFVRFDTAFAVIPAVGLALRLPAGGTLIDVTPQAITKEGFTIALAAPAPADGYVVQWVAAEAADDADASVLQSGSVTLATAAESQAVTFAAGFTAAPAVFCNVVGPDGGFVISAQPTLVTAAGFTAPIGFPIPGAGYSLSWFALAVGATTAATTLPAGATALPEDLTFAWLLQCQLVWASIDALGTALGDDKARAAATAALSTLKLAPEVEAILRGYRRLAL